MVIIKGREFEVINNDLLRCSCNGILGSYHAKGRVIRPCFFYSFDLPQPLYYVEFKELLMANSVQQDALVQLLIDKGIITRDEFFDKLKQVYAEYQSKQND